MSDPAEMIRLVNMFQALMVEVRDLELDERGRQRLLDVHQTAVAALKRLLSSDLEQELEDLGLPIHDSEATGTELRLAQSQLVGWLNGLFQGLQAAVMARQAEPAREIGQGQSMPQLGDGHGGGQYL